MRNSQQILNSLLNNLAEEKISYCVLHGYESLPEYILSDIDMAIDPQQKNKLENFLNKAAKETGFSIVQKLYYDIPHCYYYVLGKLVSSSMDVIKLDFLIDEYGINRYYLPSMTLLEGKFKYKNFYVPSYGIQAVYLLVKKALKGKFLDEHLKKLQELYSSDKKEISFFLEKYFGKHVGGETCSAIKDGNSERIFFLIPQLKKEIEKRYRQHLLTRGTWAVRRTLSRVLHPTGELIVILSPDGGGKSSVAKTSLKTLLGGFRRSEYLHWRPGVLPQIRSLLGKSKLENKLPAVNPHSPKKRSRLTSFLRWLYYSLDYILGYSLKILPMKTRSTAVVMDRYYYDIIIDPVRYGFNLPKWLLKSVLPIIPKPDLTLYLDNTPERLSERKQELPVAELKRQVEAWRDFIPSLPNAQIVTTDKPLKKVADNVVQLILNKRAKMTEKMLKVNPSAAKYLWNSDCNYIALPNKKHCRWIFPTSGNAFLRSWSLYQPYSFKGKIAKKFLQINGLLIRGPKKFIKKKELNYKEGDAFRDILAKILKREGLIMAVANGTPSPFRKINGLVMTSKGKPVSFIKIGETDLARARIIREAEILKKIERINLGEVKIPQRLYSGKLRDSHILIQTIPPFKGKIGGIEISNYTNILKILADKTAKTVPFHSSSFWKSLKDKIDNYPLSYKGLLKEGLSVLAQKTEDRKISMGLVHGDFAPWNMLWNDKEVFIYDWESANEQAPVGIDLIHFVFQVGFLLKRLRGNKLLFYINRKIGEPYQKLSLISEIKLPKKKILILTYLLHMAVVEDTPQQLSRAAVERRNLIKILMSS